MAKKEENPFQGAELMTSAQIRRILPVSASVLKRWEVRGYFPRSVKIGPSGAKTARNFWKRAEVVEFLAKHNGSSTDERLADVTPEELDESLLARDGGASDAVLNALDA